MPGLSDSDLLLHRPTNDFVNISGSGYIRQLVLRALGGGWRLGEGQECHHPHDG